MARNACQQLLPVTGAPLLRPADASARALSADTRAQTPVRQLTCASRCSRRCGPPPGHVPAPMNGRLGSAAGGGQGPREHSHCKQHDTHTMTGQTITGLPPYQPPPPPTSASSSALCEDSVPTSSSHLRERCRNRHATSEQRRPRAGPWAHGGSTAATIEACWELHGSQTGPSQSSSAMHQTRGHPSPASLQPTIARRRQGGVGKHANSRALKQRQRRLVAITEAVGLALLQHAQRTERHPQRQQQRAQIQHLLGATDS